MAAKMSRLTRRSALLGPLALLSGCGDWFDWDSVLSTPKHPLEGKREDVVHSSHGLVVTEGIGKVTLPPPVLNAAWPQDGGNPAHLMGHLQVGDKIGDAWRVAIGAGGGFRRQITATPVVIDQTVFTMDSDAVVEAFDVARGTRRWRLDTRAKQDNSTNVGGGLAIAQDLLFAATGRGDLLAIDPAKGTERWRQALAMPIRSAPTIADGRIFVVTIDDKIYALDVNGGKQLWMHPAATVTTAALGLPAPAYAQGLVIAGFGSGDLLALRAESGTLAWSDQITTGGNGNTLADISSITAMPVVSGDHVYAIGLGGLMVAIELHVGRRLWEREVASGQTPWIAGDWVFILSEDAEAAAIHIPDGNVAWVTPLPHYMNPKKQKDPISWIGPLLASDRLIVAGSNGQVLSLSPYSGKILGQIQFKKTNVAVPPIVAAKTVYMVTNDGALLAMR
jgi:outer membrane protein assembly factor BamB